MGHDDPLALAQAAVERAEHEPLLGRRIAPVLAAIDAAADLLDRVAAPELQARLMLRVAELELVKQDYEGADRALEAVGDYVPEHVPLRYLTGVRACRVALRRGPEQRKQARELLVGAAAQLAQADASDPIWQRVATEVALGAAEIGIHDEPPDHDAIEAIALIADEASGDARRRDVVFACQQLLAFHAISSGDRSRAVKSLRAVLELARSVDSAADEVEARIALASLLVADDDLASYEEARHHVQRAGERAREAGLPELQQAAQLAQAGVLASRGKTAAAIDRVLELARAASAAGDQAAFVASVGVMAELYARAGDAVSAFRTIAEASRALATATGRDTAPLFTPHLAALRDRIGADRLRQIAADVNAANALADELAEKSSRDPS